MPRDRQNATPLVSICYALAIFTGLVWAVFGTGVVTGQFLGPRASGWLSPGANLMAIPPTAQLPWFALMAGLGCYAIWQCTPTARHTELHARARGWILLLVLLNALWLQSLQRDQLGPSLLMLLGMLAVLIRLAVMIDKAPLHNQMDRWITRACFGLFTGWLSVITLAQVGAWLASHGVDPGHSIFRGAITLALLLLALVLCALTFKRPMGLYVNAGALWVIGWLVIGRYQVHAPAPVFTLTATVAGLLMLLCLLSATRTRLIGVRRGRQA